MDFDVCRSISFSEKLLKQLEYSHRSGDEGGFAPDLPDAEEHLRLVVQAEEKPDTSRVRKCAIALDVAASELV